MKIGSACFRAKLQLVIHKSISLSRYGKIDVLRLLYVQSILPSHIIVLSTGYSLAVVAESECILSLLRQTQPGVCLCGAKPSLRLQLEESPQMFDESHAEHNDNSSSYNMRAEPLNRLAGDAPYYRENISHYLRQQDHAISSHGPGRRRCMPYGDRNYHFQYQTRRRATIEALQATTSFSRECRAEDPARAPARLTVIATPKSPTSYPYPIFALGGENQRLQLVRCRQGQQDNMDFVHFGSNGDVTHSRNTIQGGSRSGAEVAAADDDDVNDDAVDDDNDIIRVMATDEYCKQKVTTTYETSELPFAKVYDLQGPRNMVYDIAFGDHDIKLVAVGADTSAFAYDVETGGLLHEFGNFQLGGARRVDTVSASFCSFLIATGSRQGDVELWDLRDHNQQGTARNTQQQRQQQQQHQQHLRCEEQEHCGFECGDYVSGKKPLMTINVGTCMYDLNQSQVATTTVAAATLNTLLPSTLSSLAAFAATTPSSSRTHRFPTTTSTPPRRHRRQHRAKHSNYPISGLKFAPQISEYALFTSTTRHPDVLLWDIRAIRGPLSRITNDDDDDDDVTDYWMTHGSGLLNSYASSSSSSSSSFLSASNVYRQQEVVDQWVDDDFSRTMRMRAQWNALQHSNTSNISNNNSNTSALTSHVIASVAPDSFSTSQLMSSSSAHSPSATIGRKRTRSQMSSPIPSSSSSSPSSPSSSSPSRSSPLSNSSSRSSSARSKASLQPFRPPQAALVTSINPCLSHHTPSPSSSSSSSPSSSSSSSAIATATNLAPNFATNLAPNFHSPLIFTPSTAKSCGAVTDMALNGDGTRLAVTCTNACVYLIDTVRYDVFLIVHD